MAAATETATAKTRDRIEAFLSDLPVWERARIEDARAEIHRRAIRRARYQQLERVERAVFRKLEWKRCQGVDEYDAEACIYFINSYGWVRADTTKVKEFLNQPFVLWERQEEAVHFFLKGLRNGDPVKLVPKSRAVGITWLILHILVWLWMFHGSSSLVGSKKAEYVNRYGDMKSLFERIRFILKRLPPWLHLVEGRDYLSTDKVISLLDGSDAAITGDSTNPDFARSGRFRVIFFDEFATLERRDAEQILESTDSAGPLWVVYNPAGEDHPTYELYKDLKKEHILELPWTADPYRPPDFLERYVLRPAGKLRPDAAARQYECSHKPDSEGLIFEWVPGIPYNEETPEWASIAQLARSSFFQLGSWDFGSGPSWMVCLLGLVEYDTEGEGVTIWIDRELVWERIHWERAAEEAIAAIREYGGDVWHVGDPTGDQRQADQESYHSRFRGRRIPLDLLPKAFNDFEAKELAIQNAQHMMDRGRLRIHERRCPHLLQSIKNWSRRLKRGDRLLNTHGRIPPLKDKHSHPGDALLYMVQAVTIYRDRLRAAGDTQANLILDAISTEMACDLLREFIAGGFREAA